MVRLSSITTSSVTLTDQVASLYSLYGLSGPFLKIELKLETIGIVSVSTVQFINGDFLSPHLQPFNGSGGGGGGSNLSGAITTDGTLLNIVNNRIKVGNLAALDKVTTDQLDDTLLNIANRKMNETQFELNDNIYSLKHVWCGTSTDTE